MQVILVLGRILFVLVFILSGAQKLMDIAGTATTIGAKVALPEALAAYTPQLEAASGMTTADDACDPGRRVEIGAALMIAAQYRRARRRGAADPVYDRGDLVFSSVLDHVRRGS